jgi:CRISPR-associated protein Csm1
MNAEITMHTEPHRRAYAVAIAALLHDVGKVLHAAGVELPTDFRERWEPLVCPLHSSGQYRTHQHALYTAYALEEIQLQTVGFSVGEIFQLAAYHHNPSGDSFDQNILTKADWLASGHDRDEGEHAEEEKQVAGLTPPLVGLQWPPNGGNPVEDSFHLPTLKLELLPETYLPQPKQSYQHYRESCDQLGNQLLSELKDFKSTDLNDCVDRLLAVLERYLHAVPASRAKRHEPDVNLFDHSRLVAAFAACLAVLHSEGPCDPLRISGRYRLVEISLGGIQAFITRAIAPMDQAPGESGEKGMAKRLRARSFYVSLVSWLLARRVLANCGLPPTNLLQDAGGRAVLLLPDEPTVLQRFERTIHQARRWFHAELGSTLRLDVAVSEPLTDADFTRDRFPRTLRHCDDRLAAARFANPWPQLLAESAWREQGWVTDAVSLPIDRERFLAAIRTLGGQLPKASCLWIDDQLDDQSLADVYRGELEILGYRVSLGEKPSPVARAFALRLDVADAQRLPLFLAASHLPLRDDEADQRLRLMQLSEEPSEPNSPLTLSEIACLSNDEEGKRIDHAMLAVLKADVDHLGMLFGYGFQQRVSFGRYAGAARYLDNFFKGFLVEQLRRHYPRIYVVFAGGDDLFLIGPWYDLVRFARYLHDSFQHAACHNPCVHLSAAIVFASPTTPVSHLAELTSDALARSKKKRNRIAYGQTTLLWDEFHQAWDLHQTMLAAAQHEKQSGVTASLVYRLLQYARQALNLVDEMKRRCRKRQNQQTVPNEVQNTKSQNSGDDHQTHTGPRRPTDLKWRSQMSYDLGRNLAHPASAGPRTNQLREELHKVLSSDDARRLYVAASLTLYYLRGEKT